MYLVHTLDIGRYELSCKTLEPYIFDMADYVENRRLFNHDDFLSFTK